MQTLGNLSEIISALTAAAALIAAIFAARYAKGQMEAGKEQLVAVNKQIDQMQHQLTIEQQRDFAAQEQLERTQASAIASWVETCDRFSNRVIIENTSVTPVKDVQVTVNTRLSYWHPAEKTYKPTFNEKVKLDVPVVPPGKYSFEYRPNPGKEKSLKAIDWHWAYGQPYSNTATPSHPVLNSPKWMVTELIFTDATGMTWVQDHEGLHRPSPTHQR
ncbi:hypothetical protein [Rothia nasimurium]|uniref:hypothetical protein n=1 Tax=Rothia nasimurium TaxID=85336 RepID=UPI002DD630ED|nr:hypothetical protein [Rothia nasimurium]